MRSRGHGSFRACIVAGMLIAVACSGAATAQTNGADISDAALFQLFQQKKYDDAAAACRAVIQRRPSDSTAHYNLACSLARMGQTNAAMASLESAVRAGFSSADHMEADEDLAALRGQPQFNALTATLREQYAKLANERYERGAEMAGVRTIEGLPDGGLRYRLRMSPAATKEKPNRLILWLHPSGGSMNRAVEPLAPRFIERGFALLVLTYKDFGGWGEDAGRRLLDGTLPEVAKIEGVDVRKPVLLGFSAGGQMALRWWGEDAGRFGGIILDAAYPIDSIPAENGGRRRLEPPKETMAKVPMFVMVGTSDPGSSLWKRVEPVWREAGMPLTVHYVPNKGHAWLVDAEREKALLEWLSLVSAGSLPGAQKK